MNARYNLVFALLKTRKIAEASEQLEQVMAAYPKDAALYNLRGELLMEQSNYGEAIAQFDEALRLEPRLEAARANRDLAFSRSAGVEK